MKFTDRLILGAVDDLIPDVPTPKELTKPEALKVQAVIKEMRAAINPGELAPVLDKIQNSVLWLIEKDPEQQQKAAEMLAKIKAILGDPNADKSQ